MRVEFYADAARLVAVLEHARLIGPLDADDPAKLSAATARLVAGLGPTWDD